jgi:trehalose synthase
MLPISKSIWDYEPFVGKKAIEELIVLAEKIKGKSIQHVNSTYIGGGVAEILNRLVPLLKNLGIESRWDVIKGDESFFKATKSFHNALHGGQTEINKEMFESYLKWNQVNASEMNFDSDIVFIHDPQPAALIKSRKKGKWIWRCHVDLSNPDPKVWGFLKEYIKAYDASIFSTPSFAREDLQIRQFLVPPSIDPLSDKNIELPEEKVFEVLEKYDISPEKPIITQISRFDQLKDPTGVIDAYKMVKKYIDCQLVLAGGLAQDDPEGVEVYQECKRKAEGDEDIHILLLPPADLIINALQRASTVVLQKSKKEGFGLTVAEALWKKKPVVASATGGIPLQVKNGLTGFLVRSIEGAAYKIRYLFRNPEFARKLGENGREHVRHNFLLTRHLRDYLLIILAIEQESNIINL